MPGKREGPPVRVVAPEGGCVTLSLGGRLVEVCCGKQAKKPEPDDDDSGVFPGLREVRGVVRLDELDVKWDERTRQVLVRVIE